MRAAVLPDHGTRTDNLFEMRSGHGEVNSFERDWSRDDQLLWMPQRRLYPRLQGAALHLRELSLPTICVKGLAVRKA